MKAEDDFWAAAYRRHDRQVFLSLLALGLAPERARDLVQTTWATLLEKQAAGQLTEIDLPGLAIKQARFLALNELRKSKSEERLLKVVEPSADSPDVEREVIGRADLEAAVKALSSLSPQAKRIFRLVYGTPPHSHAEVARSVGLSLQRVRQILCETRKHLRVAVEERSQS